MLVSAPPNHVRRRPICGALIAAATALIIAHASFAQTVHTYYVPWNSDDATDNIQDTIDRAESPSKIILTVHTTPWYTSRPIVLSKPNMQIWFANGATVMAKVGGHLGTGDPLFYVSGDNIKINGYYNGVDTTGGDNATLEMQKAAYLAAPYAWSEFRHCINVRGGSNITIQGLTLKHSGGDGITINPKEAPNESIAAYNIIINDVTCDDNYRQGMSVISVDTLTATNCVFKDTGASAGTKPRAGVDIEPSRAYDSLKAVKFVNCQFTGNVGNNVEINLNIARGPTVKPLDLRFESCLINDGVHNGMAFLHLSPTDGPTGTIVVKNTTVTNATLSGIVFTDWGVDRVPITMANVDLLECGSDGGPPPLLWTQTATDPADIVRHGDVIFQSGCHIHESFTRTNALVYVSPNISGASGPGLKDVTGTIDYHRPANSTGPIMVLGPNTVNCTLTVTPAP
jgi:hypothetical protein